MTLEELITYWVLRGEARPSAYAANHKKLNRTKLKVRLGNSHSMFIVFNDFGLINIALYADWDREFSMVRRASIRDANMTPKKVFALLKTWVNEYTELEI